MSASCTIRTVNSSAPGAAGGQPMIEKHAKTLHVFIAISLTNAVNYVTGGDTLDLTAIFGTAGLPGYLFPTGALPEKVEIQSVKPTSGAQTNLFVYSYVPGTTLANGKIQVFTGAAAQTALTELSAGAYPAGVLADVIEGEIILPMA